jgi:hypothetical protein
MSLAEWTKDADGMITLCPVCGFSSAVIAGTACGLRVEYYKTPEQFGKTPNSEQFVLTPKQAEELAQMLLTIAKVAAKPAGDTDPTH